MGTAQVYVLEIKCFTVPSESLGAVNAEVVEPSAERVIFYEVMEFIASYFLIESVKGLRKIDGKKVNAVNIISV